jgi:parvulin-like peptidyl-prolyl isomerase
MLNDAHPFQNRGTLLHSANQSLFAQSLLFVSFALAASLVSAAESTDAGELPKITEDTVVLSRGDGDVTVADLRARALEIPIEDRALFFAGRNRLDNTLRQLAETQQLAAEARRLGLDKSYEFEAAMRIGEDRTLAFIYNQHLRREALKSADLEQIARERFMANPPEASWEIKVRHILIRPHGDRAAAVERAEVLRRRVAAGESIEPLVAEYSEDEGSKPYGGLIEGPSEAFAPGFSLAALALEKEGDVAPVTETEFGFHVIQLISKTEAGRATFDSKKGQLMKEAADSVARRSITATHERLFGAEIELNEPAVGWLLANPDAFDKDPPPSKQ